MTRAMSEAFFALGVGELLIGIDGRAFCRISDHDLRLRTGKNLPVDTANTGLAELRHLLETIPPAICGEVLSASISTAKTGQALLFSFHHGQPSVWVGGGCILEEFR